MILYIHPNYLATEGDRQTMLDGIKLVRRVATSAALSDYNRREVIPGPDVQTDDELQQYIADYGNTIFHPAGTCRMGDDPLAVVDQKMRVHGVEGLRVADASVMPTVLSGNTNAGCIMLGERLAALIAQQD